MKIQKPLRCSTCRYLRVRDKLAWCAGFFDGEGWVGVRSGRKNGKMKYLSLSISQKDKRALLRLKKWTGVKGSMYFNKTANGIWVWQVSNSSDVLKLYELWAVFLGPVKIKQFTKAIMSWLKIRKEHGLIYKSKFK